MVLKEALIMAIEFIVLVTLGCLVGVLVLCF